MEITQRQEKLLDWLVRDYISLAEPISSESLQKRHNFGLSPATLRIEMQKLTDGGYLAQPHTSAGRVPTDKGYRFFVDKLLEKEVKNVNIENWFSNGNFEDTIKFFQSLTRKMALESQSLVFGYLKDEDVFWKEGWEEVLREPEFEDKNFLLNFTDFLEGFEESVGDLNADSKIKVYIGKENPFSKIHDFSIISAGVFSFLGPKRMDYQKNINLMNKLICLTKERENLEKKAAEYLAGWQRERADFLNYKKEEMERMGEFLKYAGEEMVLKLLPILDSFQLAEKKLPDNLKNDENVKGLLMIKGQIEDFLKSQGVEEIKTTGEKFDLNFMEEVEKEEQEQKGYKINNKILRVAKIKL